MQKIANYLNGVLVEPASKQYIDNYNPSTGAVYSLCPDSDERDVEAAYQAAEAALVAAILPLIKNLSWQDFELLVDLLFANAGWKRMGVLGKTEKYIDIDLLMPVNGKRAFVQIKSSSTQEELDEYIEKFESIGIYSEMYYVVHTAPNTLCVNHANKDINIINGTDLCQLVINAGMSSWLIEKAA